MSCQEAKEEQGQGGNWASHQSIQKTLEGVVLEPQLLHAVTAVPLGCTQQVQCVGPDGSSGNESPPFLQAPDY